ncbi:MAG: polysaccharide deacetylase family protein [Pseudomonadota bacterium]
MRLILFLFLMLILLAPVNDAWSKTPGDLKNGAVVIAYFTIDEDTGVGGVTPEQFAAHINALAESGANIMKLSDIVTALETGGTLPPKAIALTFEGASHSNARYAWPLLIDRKWPFTVFVSAGQMQQSASYLDAEAVKALARTKGVTIGAMPSSYDATTQGSQEFWRSLNVTRATIRDLTGQSPTLFAYPQGIPPRDFTGSLQKHGFKAGFGQQSGVVSTYNPRWLLPRYTMAQGVAGDDRIRTLLRAAPMPAFDASPLSGFVTANPPPIGFTLHASLIHRAGQMACTASDGQKGQISRLGKDRIEVRFAQATPKTRLRVNCILPDGTDDNGDDIYRWLGFLYEMPTDTKPAVTPLRVPQ